MKASDLDKQFERLFELNRMMDEIMATVEPQIAPLREEAERIAAEIKKGVQKIGETVSLHGVTAAYSQGRLLWDNTKLEGYAIAHPEILKLRKRGAPVISIRIKGENPKQ